jgi:hypothetical protein
MNIAVITSTRGRETIRQAINSVKAQTIKARHYVFAHGKDCWDAVSTATAGSDVDVVYLPVANGGGGYAMAPVYAAAPYLVGEDLIFYLDDEQKAVAHDTIADVDASSLWPGKVVTEVVPAAEFWEAEPEHQDYLLRIPNGYTCHWPRPGWKVPKRETV